MADSSFTLTFNTLPPSEALTSEGIGVGFIFLTSNPDVIQGRYIGYAADSLVRDGFLGGAANHAMIYLKAPADSLDLEESWAPRFQSGFNVGRGIRIDHGHDEFEKVEPSTIELIINDTDEIDWLNWT